MPVRETNDDSPLAHAPQGTAETAFAAKMPATDRKAGTFHAAWPVREKGEPMLPQGSRGSGMAARRRTSADGRIGRVMLVKFFVLTDGILRIDWLGRQLLGFRIIGFNVGANVSRGMFFGNVSFNFTDSAFWTDVLDARFHDATSSYAMLNAGFGVRLAEDRITAGVKLVNLNNDDAQQHIFGDIIKRQIVGELKYRFR